MTTLRGVAIGLNLLPPRTKEYKSMANYVHSTASQDMIYPIYAEGRHNQAKIVKEILIKGRANVSDPHTLVTPSGAVTQVSDEDLALLKKSEAFQRHVTHGFMKVMQDKSELDTSGMMARDNSSQLQDYEYATGKDARVPNSDMCQASCGPNNRIVGTKGNNYVGEVL